MSASQGSSEFSLLCLALLFLRLSSDLDRNVPSVFLVLQFLLQLSDFVFLRLLLCLKFAFLCFKLADLGIEIFNLLVKLGNLLL